MSSQPPPESGVPPRDPAPRPPYGGFGEAPAPWDPAPGTPDAAARRGRKPVVGAVAAVAAVVVLAAVAGGVWLARGGGRKPVALPTASASASVSPSRSAASGPDSGGLAVKPVVPGWHVVVSEEHQVAFDVPPDWTVKDSAWVYTADDADGEPVVGITSTAAYRENTCGGSPLAATGTKGLSARENAHDLEGLARTDARQWAYYGFADPSAPQGKQGTLTSNASVPFADSYGVNGYASSATLTDPPKSAKCATSGAAYTVAWTGPRNQPVVWVLYTDTGGAHTVSTGTIQAVEHSIRPVK
ncbi:hypothetical protein K7472_18535 [Streptomyces sp. PTM05]|uniref:DUF8017 domain-containing protein n=1 Tax=Streptantibioticus parmotrematis TaxID=2873249 RepID=A0ABS7QYI6_9ACTN|nr:hypothetical protein [Streptantibioticus parmotrematis]MBY8886847.1 hypothetical protein [Streptantibioticus parmotrematis]